VVNAATLLFNLGIRRQKARSNSAPSGKASGYSISEDLLRLSACNAAETHCLWSRHDFHNASKFWMCWFYPKEWSGLLQLHRFLSLAGDGEPYMICPEHSRGASLPHYSPFWFPSSRLSGEKCQEESLRRCVGLILHLDVAGHD